MSEEEIQKLLKMKERVGMLIECSENADGGKIEINGPPDNRDLKWGFCQCFCDLKELYAELEAM